MLPVDEEHAFKVLASIPPSVVVRTESWLKAIHNLILHAAPSELEKLIPRGYEIRKLHDSEEQVSLPKRKNSEEQVPLPKRRNSEKQVSLRKDIAKYFSDQGKQPSKQLLDVATDLAETTNVFLNEEYIKVWASSGLVSQPKTCETGASQRICGIMHNIDALEKSIKLTTCTFRLSLLLLSHVVEQSISLVDRSKLSNGRGRKTVVFEELARQNKVDLVKLKERFRRAKNYILIAEKCGIGSLLVVGSYPTSLEHLSRYDVELLCCYRKSRLPYLQAQCENLNHVAAQLILQGFWMYGWGCLELSKGGDIMDLVGQYVRLDLLASGQIALRLESYCSRDVLGKRDGELVQKSSESQASITRTDSGSPRSKLRKLLSGKGCSCVRGEPVTPRITHGNTPEIGMRHLANNILTFDTDGLGSGEGFGKGVEARYQHISLLPDWPPRWASLDILDSGLDCRSEAREQTNICSSTKPGGSFSNIDSTIGADRDEVCESQQGTGTMLELEADSSAPYYLPAQLSVHQNLEAPSRFVDDILMMDPETAASINMFNTSI